MTPGRGGLDPTALFVIAGDENSHPIDGDSLPGAIQQLLENPRINARNAPTSAGGPVASALEGLANKVDRGDPAFDTADFLDTNPGNLRADYVLPRRNIRIADSAVFWPVRSDPLFRLTGVFDPQWSDVGGFPTSDHRLVWADLDLPEDD